MLAARLSWRVGEIHALAIVGICVAGSLALVTRIPAGVSLVMIAVTSISIGIEVRGFALANAWLCIVPYVVTATLYVMGEHQTADSIGAMGRALVPEAFARRAVRAGRAGLLLLVKSLVGRRTVDLLTDRAQ